MYETTEACADPIAYTGEKVKYKGENYPEVYIPKDIFPMIFSDTNTYIHQNKLLDIERKIKRYYPNHQIIAVPVKNQHIPKFVELKYW